MKNKHVALVGFCVGFSVVCFIWGVLWMVMCLDYKDQVNKLQQENQELKKQLEDTNEELELVRCDLHNRTSERNGYYRNIEILENQQKEFIDYLENMLDNENDIF